ncbi:hypothetical protein G6O67_001852 [Ophiocordyceps sinensis]|uniref:Uncharacterized protein n=1 Tax=Ophiocordyceps sinensis TaxID=72228 RepID=A0A8H4PT54_9HYPO|nr:hypothetical protein G6O67_001852 [Ophiocordyceps sinensis]
MAALGTLRLAVGLLQRLLWHAAALGQVLCFRDFEATATIAVSAAALFVAAASLGWTIWAKRQDWEKKAIAESRQAGGAFSLNVSLTNISNDIQGLVKDVGECQLGIESVQGQMGALQTKKRDDLLDAAQQGQMLDLVKRQETHIARLEAIIESGMRATAATRSRPALPQRGRQACGPRQGHFFGREKCLGHLYLTDRETEMRSSEETR